MSNIWSEISGLSLATLDEGSATVIDLPVTAFTEISLISGELPPGLVVQGTQITGTPLEVSRETDFRFVLRARYGSRIEDRTFSLTVVGADEPVWQTESGLLPVGKNNTFFILDSSLVDFQLEADDPDLAAGQKLQFFIADGDGELPPGINLSESGKLSGIVDPILALERRAGDGTYDDARFDRYPYDFAERQGGRYDSFFFDSSIVDPESSQIPVYKDVFDIGDEPEDVTEFFEANPFGYSGNLYDFSTRKSQIPKKLNRYFEFRVSVSDGDTVVRRTFKIFVVGDDFLRADNTIMQVGTGIFTSDNTFLRTPVWLTPGNLGFKRANNFITLFLDVIDTNTIPGRVIYFLEGTNPGTYKILSTGEQVEGFYEITGELPRDRINGVDAEEESDFEVITPETESVLPPGTELEQATGEIFGRVPYQPAVTREYKFTVRAERRSSETTEIADSKKTFTVKLLGEIDSTIRWFTDPNLGTAESNSVSLLKVEAESSVPNSFLLYNLESGALPPGLTLSFTGEIFGKISSDDIEGETEFTFEIKARDQFGFSEITRNFTITVTDKDDRVYSDLYYKPLLPQKDRLAYSSFVNDPEIFDPSNIYRLNDPRFGIQRDPKILVYAGLEESEIEQYVAASAKYAARKTLRIDDVKAAQAKQPGTNEVIYEVVYLDLYDPYERNSKVQKKIKISNSEKILINSLRRTNESENNPINRLTVGTRLYIFNTIFFGDFITIGTRTGDVVWNISYDSTIGTRDGEVRPTYEFGSATNLTFDPSPAKTITADSDAIKVSDINSVTRYITNISNFRQELSDIGATERNFLPLWMRTAQEGSVQELGYTLAIPLVYCKPGTSERILAGIRSSQSDYDFRQNEIEVDRLLVESTADNNQEQYIVFGNFEFNIA